MNLGEGYDKERREVEGEKMKKLYLVEKLKVGLI